MTMMNAKQARERTQKVLEAQRAERQAMMQSHVENEIMGMITKAAEQRQYDILVECPDMDTRAYARVILNDLGYIVIAAKHNLLQISWHD